MLPSSQKRKREKKLPTLIVRQSALNAYRKSLPNEIIKANGRCTAKKQESSIKWFTTSGLSKTSAFISFL